MKRALLALAILSTALWATHLLRQESEDATRAFPARPDSAVAHASQDIAGRQSQPTSNSRQNGIPRDTNASMAASPAFQDATDALEYIDELSNEEPLSARAMYFTGKMLKECEEASTAYFPVIEPSGGRQDVATAIARLGTNVTECGARRIERTWSRCQSYFERDGARTHGDAQSWIERASAAGDPSASAVLGASLWSAGLQATQTRSTTSTAGARPSPTQDIEIGLQLIERAAHSRDPEALSQLALKAPFVSGKTSVDRGALILASCQGDEACERNSELACYLSSADPSLDSSLGVRKILETQNAGSEYEAMREKAERVISTWSSAEVDELFIKPFRDLRDLVAKQQSSRR